MLALTLAASLSAGQQPGPVSNIDSAPAVKPRVMVYAVGPGTTAPALTSAAEAPLGGDSCKGKIGGVVQIALVVDATGTPHNLSFIHPLGLDLDKAALAIVEADRFKPGLHDGGPVAVGMSAELDIRGCVKHAKDQSGIKADLLMLKTQPKQEFAPIAWPTGDAVLTTESNPAAEPEKSSSHASRVGGFVSAPVPLFTPEATYTDAARRARIKGVCTISFVADSQGMPQNVHIARSLDPGLDESAMQTVLRYRFKPAMKDGGPVAVYLTVEVKFDLY
jgi:TonB family protein